MKLGTRPAISCRVIDCSKHSQERQHGGQGPCGDVGAGSVSRLSRSPLRQSAHRSSVLRRPHVRRRMAAVRNKIRRRLIDESQLTIAIKTPGQLDLGGFSNGLRKSSRHPRTLVPSAYFNALLSVMLARWRGGPSFRRAGISC